MNAKGADITIKNTRIWTGDPQNPWAAAMTVRGGKVAAMNADQPAGEVMDLGGRLVVPGMWDCHTHPQAPYVLFSPEAPTLFGAKTSGEVLDRLRKYVKDHPEDKFPRLFGWMGDIFPKDAKPTRQMIDAVVSDRPVYLVHHGGHAHWVNTTALEMANALEKDPPDMRGDGHIERDPKTSLATGHMQETEYAATHGVMLNTVKRVKPYTFEEQVLLQRAILEEYPKVGVTSIWTKDGDIDITRVYERILRKDALPVRVVLDNMYTPYSNLDDIRKFAERGKELAQSDLPKGFLRADVAKLFIDLPIKGWKWMFEPYADGSGGAGRPAFPIEDFRAQMREADRLGLQINISVYGDRALHECLNILEETARANPPRERRHMIEHAEFIKDADLPRFRQLGVIPSMNPNGVYPDEGFQTMLRQAMGEKRLAEEYQRYSDLLKAGALMVNGSDFPLFPMDPLIGINLLVNGTGIDGKPKGGLWPQKQITIEEALRTYTVNPAYANFAEKRLGMLRAGYDADFVVLSEDILAPDFDKTRLMWVKAAMTVLNGHIMHKDFSENRKVIDFAK
ncbi:MAG: amidohydrolase [Planctomycetota bacterium]